MGIGLTRQQVEGWEGQYERMLRWHERARRAVQENRFDDELDFLLVFFEQVLSLRDWIKVALPDASADIERLFRTQVELRICRDIANGYKHMRLRKKPFDAGFSIVHAYNPRDGREYDPVVLAGGHQFELLDLAERCASLLKEFVESRQLEPSSVAKARAL